MLLPEKLQLLEAPIASSASRNASATLGLAPANSQNHMHLLRDGERIGDTYEVERFISEGAFGQVYRVKHRFLGRLAMKVFKLPTMPLAEAQAMLEEAFVLSRIGHPNIVRVFDAGLAQVPQFALRAEKLFSDGRVRCGSAVPVGGRRGAM